MKLVYEDDTILIYVYYIEGEKHIQVSHYPNKEAKNVSKRLHEIIMRRWLGEKSSPS